MTAAGHKVYTGILLGFAVVAVVFLCKVARRTSYGKYTSGHDIYADYMACWTFATDVVLLTGTLIAVFVDRLLIIHGI